MGVEVLERPLPKPTTEDYIAARLLEALIEAKLAIEFLSRGGLVRNSAGKAFQAWRAFLAALLRLELDKLLQVAKTEEERKWLMERAVPRVPTSRMISLSQMLEGGIGYSGLSFVTAMALNLHDYQYNGPDPDLALSKFRDRQEAAVAVAGLVRELANRIENLKQRIKWSNELENALNELRKAIK
ncbi:PaREP1 family protein [Vulcanisaeta distributa]|uniref:PaREP1 family protein n=1 Tax=Vulcanisaeta distributa TaxID=164451 RepID=UPI000B18FDB0|nr:PaREP1 family protein [Vulcanisaeta distributa]